MKHFILLNSSSLNISESIIEESYLKDNDYKKIIESLKSQNKDLRIQNTTLLNKLNTQKLDLYNEFQSELEKNNLEMIKLKMENSKSKNEYPLIKEAINNVREIINGLVPEEVYLRLKNISENNLNIHEYVLTKTYEICAPLIKEKKALKIDNSNLRDEIKIKNDKIKNLITEIEYLQSNIEHKDKDAQRYNTNYDNP